MGRRVRAWWVLGLLPLCVWWAWPVAAEAEKDERPWSEQPFLGLSVRDGPNGLVVGWIAPGPLGGRGFESKTGIKRGDNVDSLDGKRYDRKGFEAAIAAHKVGDRITLITRRAPAAKTDGGVPQGGDGGEAATHVVTLSDRDTWSGTIGRGLDGRRIPDVPEGAHAKLVLEAAEALGLREGEHGGGLDALEAHLRTVLARDMDRNALAAVVQAFRQPLHLDAVEAEVDRHVDAARSGTEAGVQKLLEGILHIRRRPEMVATIMGKPAEELDAAAKGGLVRFCGAHLVDEKHQKDRANVERLLRTLRKDFYLYDEHADSHVATIREIGRRMDDLLFLPFTMLTYAPGAWRATGRAHASDAPLTDLPEAVRKAVPEGRVLWHGKDAMGRLAVVGGKGANRYDMQRLGAVYDVGGDDTYVWDRSTTISPGALEVVIDVAGNDTYESRAPFTGPGAGVYALSWLEDQGGNDTYRSQHAFSVASGLCGLGILVDQGGNDIYENTGTEAGWSIGAGFWGAGILIDQGGKDVYRGEKLCQGVGGPRGLGLILEGGGRDLYVANGPSFASAYGTPGVYLGMSQGFGFGVRGYAAGGIGAIYDDGGRDQYIAGEFSQAGGYYWGLGILHDAKGDDLYHGNRYGQAFAAHQAAGILIDDDGDDTYWSMTAASQAGTWDESVGLLLDRAGNDSYRCDGLGQGGASMQALALLIDLGGDDRYSAAGGSTQGQGGSNSYHYDKSRVFSFSGLFDLGGGTDSYRKPRANDTQIATGRYQPKNPKNSSLYGVFVDR